MDNKEFSSAENGCGQSGSGEKMGGGMCSHPQPPTPKADPPPITATTNVPLEMHVCMGLNACKGHDRFGTNDCAGTGSCATASVHHCRTLNNCRGQGGCGLFGSAEDDATPGANECAWQGACAVPIQAERFSTQGENKGKSVWVLARRLFEDRMKRANRTFGPSPYQCGPPQAWLIESLGSYDSCGSAGNKYCTFGFNNPAKDAKELCEKSQPHILCGATATVESANLHCSGGRHCNDPAVTDKSGADTGSEANKCSVDKISDANSCAHNRSTHCGSPEGGDASHCGSPEKSSDNE